MSKLRIGIIGAGIQGVCNALFLQKKGHEVIILIKMNLVVEHRMVMLVIFHLMHLFH